MKKKFSIVLFVSALFLIIVLFCGVYKHDEFAEKHFFIKHRPTLKWTFYSPLGMSDMKIEELSNEKQIEQIYFNEFVLDQGLSQ